MNNSAKFFHQFAATFDTFYDHQRSPFMQWVDRRFRSDMFIRYALTFQHLGDLAGKHVLDIGCGSGPYLTEALRRGATLATGIDPAPGMLALARQRSLRQGVAPHLHLIEGAFPEVPLEGVYHYAIVMGVMDYIAAPQPFLQALKRTITERAVISFPSTHWLRTPIRKIRYAVRRCPVYFYSRPGIQMLLQHNGFSRFEILKIPGAGMDYFVWMEP